MGEVDTLADNILKTTTRSTRGQEQKLLVKQSRTNPHLYSFFPSAIRLWNTLPSASIAAPSVQGFKASLREWARSVCCVLFIYLFVYLFIYLFTYLLSYLFLLLFIYLCVCLFIYLLICLYLYLVLLNVIVFYLSLSYNNVYIYILHL